MTQDEAIEFERLKTARDSLLMTVANLRGQLETIAADEREACAEVCKKHADVYAGLEQNPITQSAWAACIDLQDAIRARGKE
jgi:hypothetical protein